MANRLCFSLALKTPCWRSPLVSCYLMVSTDQGECVTKGLEHVLFGVNSLKLNSCKFAHLNCLSFYLVGFRGLLTVEKVVLVWASVVAEGQCQDGAGYMCCMQVS